MKNLPIARHASKETLKKIKELQLHVSITQAVDAKSPQVRRAQKKTSHLSNWVGVDTQFAKQGTMTDSVVSYLSAAEQCNIDDVYWIPVTRIISNNVAEYIECDKNSDSVHGVTGWLYALKEQVRDHYVRMGDISKELPVTDIDIEKEDNELFGKVREDFFLRDMQEQGAWENGEVYNVTAYSRLDFNMNAVAHEKQIYNIKNHVLLSIKNVVNDCYQNICMAGNLKSIAVEFNGSDFVEIDHLIAKNYLIDNINKAFNIRLVTGNAHYREDLDKLIIQYLPESLPMMSEVEKVRGERTYRECMAKLREIKPSADTHEGTHAALNIMQEQAPRNWSDDMQGALFAVMANNIDKIKSIELCQ